MITGTEKDMMLILVGLFVLLFLILFGLIIKKRLRSKPTSTLDHSDVSDQGELEQLVNEILTEVKSDDLIESPSVSRSSLETQGQAQLKHSLQASNLSFWARIKDAIGQNQTQAQLDAIEEVLYTSDLGPKVVNRFMTKLQALSIDQRSNISFLQQTVSTEMVSILSQIKAPAELYSGEFQQKLTVLLIVGVNGAGKTTTIGKMAARYCQQGKKVLVAAGDTFRAAAGAQLAAWADRAQVEIFAPENIKDPAAVAFAAIELAKAQNFDVVLIDTAGRLHTSHNLMEELKKVHRVMQKSITEAPHYTLLVLDASGGQNGVIQAQKFNEVVPLSGLIITKLDGTAKGGMAMGAVEAIQAPIVWLGVGEKTQDLLDFEAQTFANELVR